MSSFTPELGLIQPVPFDPAVANIWGTLLNTDFGLIDSAVAGLLSLNVSGNTDVILTSTAGAADQARNSVFVFTGTLTGTVRIFWPNGVTGKFIASNKTSGAFILQCAVNNGSGSPAGDTINIPQGGTALLATNGTDVFQGVSLIGIQAAQLGANSNITSLSGLTTPLSIAQGGTASTSASAARTALGLGSIAIVSETASTSGPSGTPGNGDLWFQYAP